MKQLTQELKSGRMEILEVPFPIMEENEILVHNHYSVISTGTEGKTVKDARKGYISKALSRQKEVKQAIQMIKSEGFKKTYNIVMNKLNAPSTLGYSCAGEVIAVGSQVRDINVGDHIACGGKGAVHAEVVSVPRNLCVKVDKSIDLRHAALTSVAAVAIQGIRQADLRFGENCVVIGLGLIGQLTIQILKASGISAIGIDLDARAVNSAKENGADMSMLRKKDGLIPGIIDFTGGIGADAVIITAGTLSNDPVELAGDLLRKKGRVVIVGACPTGFSRKNYYQKELELRMSTSYGPGRYDDNYELKGQDYPIGYVRFTENRNMLTYVNMLETGKIHVEKLITHSFKFNEVFDAYKMIIDKSDYYLGILLEYQDRKLEKDIILQKNQYPEEEVNVGMVGAGSFAQNAILPRIYKHCNLVGIVAKESNVSRHLADKYQFDYSTSNAERIIKDSLINTIFILTRHNLHAPFVKDALKQNKHVYVEKPLAMSFEDLNEIKDLYYKSKVSKLMVGFNRRFAPFVEKIIMRLPENSKKAINMKINTGKLPPEHWVHDKEYGGGRIIGEVCHYIDLSMHLARSPITKLNANALKDGNHLMDSVVINLTFANGSIASICYFSNGSRRLPKEYIEVNCNESSYIIEDFQKLTVLADKVYIQKKSQDKGHAKELYSFIQSIRTGSDAPIPFYELYLSSLATLKVIESITSSRTIHLDEYIQYN